MLTAGIADVDEPRTLVELHRLQNTDYLEQRLHIEPTLNEAHKTSKPAAYRSACTSVFMVFITGTRACPNACVRPCARLLGEVFEELLVPNDLVDQVCGQLDSQLPTCMRLMNVSVAAAA
jgi:hypothetical protein